ncbi:MAG: beta-lactamase family protein [Chitinophagaceae bacterium]|nr:beta-lactamase family protein [Chitinophagaceae bacterium]
MAHKVKFFCLHFRLFIIALLFLQFVQAQNNFSKLDDWLDNNVSNLGGRAVLLVWKDGKTVYENAANELTRKQKFIGKRIAKKTGRDIDLNDFDANTKQRIASCSKWLTAALAMTFVDEKKINLEDSIGKFLPVMTTHGKGNIKVWHCLSHLTGIKQIGVMDAMNNGDENGRGSFREKMQQKQNGGLSNKLNPWNSMQDAMDSIAKTEMEGEPGKTFHYGNAGLQIIAAICEVVGNKDFETLFQERIAKPLKMKDTDFGNVKVPLAAGGAYSTPNDYLKFLQMILNHGKFNGKQIISKQSIIDMQKNYVSKDCKIVYTPVEAGNWGYGFGAWVMDNAIGNQRSSAITSPGLFGTFPWVDNEKKYCAILFTLNIKSKGRGERYKELKQLVDEAY